MKKDDLVVIRDKAGNVMQKVDVSKTADDVLESVIRGLRNAHPNCEIDTSNVARLKQE